MKARVYLSKSMQQQSPLYKIYMVHLLETIISKGDVHESDKTHQTDVELAAREIIQLLKPLTYLISAEACRGLLTQDENTARLFREAWFNIVVHGITPISKYGQLCIDDLRNFARQSVPLVAEDRTDQFESEIELNTVLRRGMNAPHTAEQKRSLISLLPQCESDIRGLSYPKVLFLSATYHLESLRAETGTCNHILTYFRDPSLDGNAMENCMFAITEGVLTTYLQRALMGRYQDTSASQVAKQLALVLAACCHRIPRVQQVATKCADRIITQVPSSLCQRTSLFALLELLSIMWSSCLEAEIDTYDWKSRFTSARGEVSVEMSDDHELRGNTLSNFHRRAKIWLSRVINIAPLDVKGILQV
jgi:phosphatidylinositol 4-kinase A